MEPHTIIALELNGKPVPHLHGGPARLIVPGWVGSASIKWLTEITLAQKEWDGPFMARSYRSPRVDDPKESYSLTSLECKSIVVQPADGAQIAGGHADGARIRLGGRGRDRRRGRLDRWGPDLGTRAPCGRGAPIRLAAVGAPVGRQGRRGHRHGASQRLTGAGPARIPAARSAGIPLECDSRRPRECLLEDRRGPRQPPPNLPQNRIAPASRRSNSGKLRHVRKGVAILAAVLIAAVGGDWVSARARDDAAEQVVNPLPPDERQQLVTGRCIICHSLETIAQQRQTRDEWAVILDRMVAYGMPMLPGDRELILDYLATRLGQ